MILVVVLVAGLSLLLYPTVASWWNSMHATHAIDVYDNVLKTLNTSDYDERFQEAIEYNQKLINNRSRFYPSEEESAEYSRLLSVDGSALMGLIEIPGEDISLPIYHGTSEDVLAAGAGHLEGSSLPIGGESTHSVISGHRGLPSAKMFDNIVNLKEGDLFMVTVLNRTAIYEVDEIRTVLPAEVESLEIQDGEDLCTLVTCTPYGINTHRILITGHRVDNLPEDYHGRTEARVISPYLVAIVLAIIALAALFVLVMLRHRKPKRPEDGKGSQTDHRPSAGRRQPDRTDDPSSS